MYQPAAVSGAAAAAGPAGGAWSVLYKAVSRAFTVANPEAAARLVILRPSVTLNGGNIAQVSWTYVDRTTGAALAAPPPFVSQIQVSSRGAARRHGVHVSRRSSGRRPPMSTDPASDPDCQRLGALQLGDRDRHDVRGLADR